ncbi:hypothetical protein D9615_000855 [Tricholomella constricta]|uniref:Uncharacterized protein n=1 Tax=Tricholomella constricta TaxID=117010 RepID=A0A8H5HR27_9AGAR|nr:hypothetical protein D9615_000855 [Tricholomella constricta]
MPSESAFNYIAGGLTFLTIAFSLRALIQRYLPQTQMELYDALLLDTKNIYSRACEEGLLPADMSQKTKVQLNNFENQADDLRIVRYHESTARDILTWGQRWSKISRLYAELMNLRIKLVTTSQEERARRGEPFGDAVGHNVLDASQSAEEGTHDLAPSGVAAENPSPSTISASHIDTSSTPARHSSFCICSLLQWLLNVRSGASSPSDGPAQGEADSSVPDSLSRSSTLVDEPLPKAPCWRKWGHDTNSLVLEDLEAGSGPSTPLFFEMRKGCGEPTEMDITSVRV